MPDNFWGFLSALFILVLLVVIGNMFSTGEAKVTHVRDIEKELE